MGYTGRFIPGLPEKTTMSSVVSKFDEKFLESRRAALQLFMKRLATHQFLSETEGFKEFLENSQEEFTAKRSEHAKEAQGASSGWVSNMWKDIKGLNFANRPAAPPDQEFDPIS